MNYLFLMYGSETSWTDAERNECMTEGLALCRKLKAEGKFIATSPLEPVATAVTLRNRGDAPLVTVGPYAETTEQLGGFFLLDLADKDEAIAVASKMPPIRKGTAEIRPVMAFEGLPSARPIPDSDDSPLKPYMLISYDNEAAWEAAGPEAMELAKAKVVELCQELYDQGRLILVSALQPAATATTVRSRNGRVIVTDGPFAETNEVVGGFYVVLAESHEEAVNLARRHPTGNRSDVEVRPLLDMGPLKKTLGISL